MSELNELSRKTLKSYVSKANKDFKKNVKIDDHDTIHTSNPRKYMKRSEMIDVAKDKLQEESMNEQTLELIDAIESGKSTAIETSFNEIMANKLVSAIDNRRQEIASGLFDMQEETVEEAAKWRQGYSASGHPAGFKHKSGEIGPVGGTFTNEPADYDGETKKVPVQKHRDKEDELSGRANTKLSTTGKPLLPRNALKNLKGAIKQSAGKHGPVGVLPEGVVPGSVKKDKEGNVTRFTSVADKNIRQKEIDRRNKERQRELQGRSATRSNGQPLDTEE